MAVLVRPCLIEPSQVVCELPRAEHHWQNLMLD